VFNISIGKDGLDGYTVTV